MAHVCFVEPLREAFVAANGVEELELAFSDAPREILSVFAALATRAPDRMDPTRNERVSVSWNKAKSTISGGRWCM